MLDLFELMGGVIQLPAHLFQFQPGGRAGMAVGDAVAEEQYRADFAGVGKNSGAGRRCRPLRVRLEIQG